MKTYKFRLYPTKENVEKLLFTLDKCRYVYNVLLERMNEQDLIDRGQIQEDVTDLMRIDDELKNVYSKTLQYECHRLFSNLKALSRLKKNGKKVGKLRFKNGESFKTFVYNQSGFKVLDTGNRLDRLHLSKIGNTPIRIHREIKGIVKQVCVKKYASGKWFAFLVVDDSKTYSKPSNEFASSSSVGIDVGIENFAYDSDGNRFDNPRFLNKSLEKLKTEQRKFSRMKKGSKNRQKQKLKIAIIHETIADQRCDFVHKLSNYYVKKYRFIAVEDLNIKNLIGISHNANDIRDASWGRFLRFIEYKAERAGIRFVRVPPGGTTQKCSSCGRKVPKKLSDRVHKCECGYTADRDYNSARNILLSGLERASPLETEPIPSNRQVPSMNQETSGLDRGSSQG